MPDIGKKLPPVPTLLSSGAFGASAVIAAAGIGSGELMFVPMLILQNGSSAFLIVLFSLLLQWFFNIEIARYSLATGTTYPQGLASSSKIWGALLLLAVLIPWLWPGWVRVCGQILDATLGWKEQAASSAILVLCGIILAAPRRIMAVVETIQTAFIAFIFIATLIILFIVLQKPEPALDFFVQMVNPNGLSKLGSALLNAQGAQFYTMITGLVYVGAGGMLNIGYGIMVLEKKFGLGVYAQPLPGIRHAFGRRDSATNPLFLDSSHDNQALWKKWMQFIRRESGWMFLGMNIFSTLLWSVILFCLFSGSAFQGTGIEFLKEVLIRFESAYGSFMAGLFAVMAFLVFFTTALGIIDVAARISAIILTKLIPALRGREALSTHAFVAFIVLFGLTLILLDPRQPFWFLTTNAVLNTFAMAFFPLSILWLNSRKIEAFARPQWAEKATMIVMALFFAVLSTLIIVKLLG